MPFEDDFRWQHFAFAADGLVSKHAAACREIHARGMTLVTWIAKNPAL